MSFTDFKFIIDKISKIAIRVALYGYGEPLLNKDLFKMIKYCSSVAISTSISTNFNRFSRDDLNELFESKLTMLLPCLDGFTQENYEKYRIRGNVDKVKENIKLVMDAKRKRNLTKPFVDVQVVLLDYT
jgi:MoaA/NifB/PqqE/SkfB family radical SAM enzyme